MFVAKVVRCSPLLKAVCVSVQNMELDPYVHVYFNKEEQLWAADPDQKYNVGDLVLVKKLSEPEIKDVNHFVAETVFPIGNVIDPVTGRRCRGPQYVDEVNRHFSKLDFSEPPAVPSKKS